MGDRSGGIFRFALLTAAASFLLIVAGGLVTSTDSGLSVPDWPLSYGKVFPPMVGGIRFEHSHRLIAATVGILTFFLTFWIVRREKRAWVKRFSLLASGAVLLQGILGGITVLLGLPVFVSVAHALLGNTFFAAAVLLSIVLSRGWKESKVKGNPSLLGLSILMLSLLYLQLFLGALLRHAGWTKALVTAHMAGAGAVLAIGLYLAAKLFKIGGRQPLFAGYAKRLMLLLFLQVTLGVITWIRGAGVLEATAHVATGALLLATTAALCAHLLRSGMGEFSRRILSYVELTKPRLTVLAVLSGLCGFLLGAGGFFEMGKLIAALLGTALIGGGAAALNQVLEAKQDGLMQRTKNRPIPSGRVTREAGLFFGVVLSSLGLLVLTLFTHPFSGLLGVITLVSYLFIYTPLKRKTSLCTLVGAVPGAMPPLIGWAASRGGLELSSWVLFAILFLWQLPHFLAIAWTYREDYRAAGFQMLPVLDSAGQATGRQIALYLAALVPVSIFPAGLRMAGGFYLAFALAGSLAFFGVGLLAVKNPTPLSAKRLFVASILYLPFILGTMTLDRIL